MKLSKHLLVAAMAAMLSIVAISSAPVAAQSDQPGWHRSMSAEDRAALLDARIAALKVGLKLTSDQEKNWSPLENALREQAKERAERFAAWREQRANHEEHRGVMQMRSRWLQRMTQRAVDLEKLIAAVKPLYDTLDEGQKRRFAELMRPPGGDYRQHRRREG